MERNVKILASVVVFLFLLLLPSFVLQPEIYFNFIFLRENTNFHSGRFFFSPPLKTRFQLFRPIRSETSSPGSGKNRNQTNPGPNFRKTHKFFTKYSPKHNENEIRFAKNNNKITKNLNKVVAAAASVVVVVVVVFKHSFSMLLQQERQRPSRPLTSTLLTLLQGKKPISAPTQRRRRRRK